MKLAFCLFKYFPYGGLQRDLVRIAKACRERGHEIHIFTMQWEGDLIPGFTLHLINAKGLQNHTRAHSFRKQVKAAMAAEAYDLVIGFNKMPGLDLYYAADVCYQTRAREKHHFLYRLLPRYRQLLAFESAVFKEQETTDILLISALQQKEYTACYQTKAERFHLLPPGIARDRMAPSNAGAIRANVRQSFDISDDDFIILMLGSGFKTKGLDRSIAALAALPNELKQHCYLFVIGQDRPEFFQRLATRLQVSDKIKFLGGRPDVLNFLLASDLLLHPAYHENTGTVLLEAMIAGLPVLTVDVCGYAHYVKEADAGNVLASPFKQIKLNAALKAMLTSNQREVWRQNGLAFGKAADIYSLPERAAELIESRYKQMLNKLSFDKAMTLTGECFRRQKGRTTQQITIDDKNYFIKLHTGVGWFEIFKNLLQFRLPVVSAKNEWCAIQKLQSIGIGVPAVCHYGERGVNPAKKQSYVLMEAITPSISLETLCQHWVKEKPDFTFKQKLITEVARISRLMHEHGINHRDYYLCHFLLETADHYGKQKNNITLTLIDLHRAQMRNKIPQRWRVKDLAGLYFSSKDIGLTKRDLLRFIKQYRGQSLRKIVTSDNTLWNKVIQRGEQLYRDHR